VKWSCALWPCCQSVRWIYIFVYIKVYIPLTRPLFFPQLHLQRKERLRQHVKWNETKRNETSALFALNYAYGEGKRRQRVVKRKGERKSVGSRAISHAGGRWVVVAGKFVGNSMGGRPTNNTKIKSRSREQVRAHRPQSRDLEGPQPTALKLMRRICAI